MNFHKTKHDQQNNTFNKISSDRKKDLEIFASLVDSTHDSNDDNKSSTHEKAFCNKQNDSRRDNKQKSEA